jgi:ATP-dependent helicase HrpA
MSTGSLRERLPQLMVRDAVQLGRRLDGVPKIRGTDAQAAALADITIAVERAEQRIERRRAAVPTIRYPEDLPVAQRRDDLLAAIRDSQVVIVAGETGSGKTTQLPKICLDLGRGVRGLIGHTQPRRLAARSVAERIAEEIGTPLGETVGYQVRFTEQVSDKSLVKIMTDGILLAEIQHDRSLQRYDTIIIDEAHERSLNIDFLLGYLKRLLPRRPDLKLIITSATIDPERFSRHFDDAPILEVSGRTYPVDVRYRPLLDEGDDPSAAGDSRYAAEDNLRDQITAVCDAVGELQAEGPGDILVFLSGEREIRDTADALSRLVTSGRLRDTEVLPLYARLSAAEQHRVFSPSRGRRVVLATNVAETSLTVPGIRYVIDPGTARISRYSTRLKVQRLPIERISQASANQRAGRCGRVAAGICVRLYSQEDFDARPEFTEPEILRTNLASVILQMTALGLGDIAAFPFVEPPDRRNIRDGISLLHELGALEAGADQKQRRLTPIGRRLAALPLDPRLARMVVAADDNGCLGEVLVIASGLAIQDPRERPSDAQDAADARHRRFADPTSDFLGLLHLWRYLRHQQRELSSSQFRRMCKAEYLHYLRVREWQDVHGQLRAIAQGLGMQPQKAPAFAPLEPDNANDLRSDVPNADAVHQSLLAGLLSHVGLRDQEKRDYLGARGARFAIFPGSALFRKPPRFVMAAELVETSRLYARVVARVEPEWVEQLAGHLVVRSYSEPHWEKDRGAVMAYERVTLFGIPLIANRKVTYGRIDPELSRELFIRHALVQGEWRTHHKFFAANRELLEDVEELENRARRRDILVDDETLFEFYDRRVDASVVSARHFDAWWKKARHADPQLLTFSPELLVNPAAATVATTDYPDTWRQGDLTLPLTYSFDPGTSDDGVTVHIPLPVLNRLQDRGFDWLVPGLRHDLVTALLKSLPKSLRRHVVPAPDVASSVLEDISPDDGPLLDVLADELRRRSGIVVQRSDWGLRDVPAHLRMTFLVEDDQHQPVGEGKDLGALQRKLGGDVSAVVAQATEDIERSGLSTWTVGTLPPVVERRSGKQVIRGFPALVDERTSVALRVLPTEMEARRATWAGQRRLLMLAATAPIRAVQRALPNATKLALARAPHGSAAAVLEDCVLCALDFLMVHAGAPVREEAAFARLSDAVRADLHDTTLEVLRTTADIVTAAGEVEATMAGLTGSALQPAIDDVRRQLQALVYAGFVTETGKDRLRDVVRYLRAANRRLEVLRQDPARDTVRMQRVAAVERARQEFVDRIRPEERENESVIRLRWMVEELRVSLFAQSLGTAYPISEERIYRAVDAARDELAESARDAS